MALADTLHFGKAAEACHVSQPTLSAQVKKLEEYLGTPLVERRPRHVQLTETGQQVVERARRLLKEADDILEVARTDRDPLAGRLKVGLIPTIAPYLLPRVAPKIRRALPKLNLMLYEYQTAPLLERVREGDLDLAILALPAETEGLDTRTLFAEAFVVAMPARHRLATRKRVGSRSRSCSARPPLRRRATFANPSSTATRSSSPPRGTSGRRAPGAGRPGA